VTHRWVTFFSKKERLRYSFHLCHILPGIATLGGCPRIVIFSQIEECGKNYRRYIVDIPTILFWIWQRVEEKGHSRTASWSSLGEL